MAARQSVSGKVVLITGASRGIGAAVAREASRRGASVVLLGRDTEALEKVTASLAGPAAWFAADVTSEEQMQAAIDGAVARFGGIDVVVANAGMVSYGTIFLCDTAKFSQVMETNVTGVYRTVKLALPHLQRSRGYALLVSSMSAISSMGGLGPYAASKAAIDMLSHVLYQELDHVGVGVGTLYSSWVDTDLIGNAEEAMPAFGAMRRRWAKVAELPGLKSWPGGTATPEEAARIAVSTIERRGRRGWVPWTLWGMNFSRPVLNSKQGARVQIRLFDSAVRASDEDLRRSGRG